MKTKLLVLLAALGLASVSSRAATFTFDDENTVLGSYFDGLTSGSYTIDGIKITLTSNFDEFNATGSNFGINQSASGDDTDGFDFDDTEGSTGGLAEGFTISFDQDVELVSFTVSSWSAGNDVVTISDDITTVTTITSTGTTSLGNYALAQGSTLSVDTTAGTYGNGWSFDSITVIPEPSSIIMMGLVGLASVMVLRKRK
ncbi:PEP-CTERM sorting domain-containing protein [Kiritimatiellaeota bacterium B1221]|nr:PEP-CTERM sorting domain-containing protein [Kiritimatiellaeota bacterium B1221]